MEPAHNPFKLAGIGGNREGLVTCPVAGSFQPPLGFVSASQCSSMGLALVDPEAAYGQAVQ